MVGGWVKNCARAERERRSGEQRWDTTATCCDHQHEWRLQQKSIHWGNWEMQFAKWHKRSQIFPQKKNTTKISVQVAHVPIIVDDKFRGLPLQSCSVRIPRKKLVPSFSNKNCEKKIAAKNAPAFGLPSAMPASKLLLPLPPSTPTDRQWLAFISTAAYACLELALRSQWRICFALPANDRSAHPPIAGVAGRAVAGSLRLLHDSM